MEPNKELGQEKAQAEELRRRKMAFCQTLIATYQTGALTKDTYAETVEGLLLKFNLETLPLDFLSSQAIAPEDIEAQKRLIDDCIQILHFELARLANQESS